jgi:hypothetical protein
MPFILLLIYLGTFAEKNAFEDLFVVLAFGFLGWIMVQLDWQRPPLLLGLVLGPLMENRLFLSTDNYGLAWLWRPGVLIFFALTLFGIFYPTVKKTWQKRKGESEGLKPSAVRAAERGRFRLSFAVIFSLSMVVVLARALWESRNFGFRAGLFPWAIGFPVLALAVVQLAMDLTGKTRKSAEMSVADAAPELPKAVVYRRTTEIIAWILGLLVAIWLLGFSAAVPVATFLYLKVAGREKWPITVVLTLVSWLFFYVLFDYALRIPFPDGKLFETLSLWPR